MLLGDMVDISPEALRTALLPARSLFSEEWLNQQKQKNPTDPLLYTQLSMASAGQVSRALREGISNKDDVHPLAQAVWGTERILAHYDKSGEFNFGTFAYQLLSLRDVAENLDNVKNMRERLARLTGDQWRSALYELLVASSQATLDAVELLSETGSDIPDMAINNDLFLECKAKTQQDGKVVDFVRRFQRLALDKIFQEIHKIGDGLLVEIDVHDEAGIPDIPNLLRSMFANKLRRKSTFLVKIKVTPYQPGPFDLPHPMKGHSAELWRWLMNFDSWHEWHVVQPYGEFMVSNASNMIVKTVRRPILVCARSTKLLKSAQNIRATIAAACRQLKHYQPGIVRVLVNSRLYGIGSNSDAATVKADLDVLSRKLLNDYSRLAAVRFDIVTPPDYGSVQAHYTSAGAVRRTEGRRDFNAIASAPGILLL